MAQLVQLEQGVVEVLELEVGGQQTVRHIVRRMLDGAEIVDLIGVRHDDHAAGMLAGGALDAGAALGQPVLLRPVYRPFVANSSSRRLFVSGQLMAQK